MDLPCPTDAFRRRDMPGENTFQGMAENLVIISKVRARNGPLSELNRGKDCGRED